MTPLESNDGEILLGDLPQLAACDVMTDFDGLKLDGQGQLTAKSRQDLALTFRYHGRRLSARLSRDAGGRIRLEAGCDLAPIPYSAESATLRRRFLDRVAVARTGCTGEFAATSTRWLYIRDRLELEDEPMTACWLVCQLTLLALILRPVIDMFAEFAAET